MNNTNDLLNPFLGNNSMTEEDIIKFQKIIEEGIIPDECILFSEKAFNNEYPSLDKKKENDLRILQIKEKLTGAPEYVEYNDEYFEEINNLLETYPNFNEYRDVFLPDQRLMLIKNDKTIRWENILIVGEPSCGKSSFTKCLCEIYGASYQISLGNGSVNFTLMGNDKGYEKSDCGDILKALFKKGSNNPVANPIVILDEIDKANYNDGTDKDLSGSFSILLEKNNAKSFSDNFFKVPVDASGINYIAIANDISTIPSHVLSRFPIKLFIRNYTEEELKTVVIDNVYKKWIKDNHFIENAVAQNLPQDTKEIILRLCNGEPRSIPAILNSIVGKTLKRNGVRYYANFELTENQKEELKERFCAESPVKHRTIGFH